MRGIISSQTAKEKAIKMLKEGYKVSDIARELNCARGSIYPCMKAWGIDIKAVRAETGLAAKREAVNKQATKRGRIDHGKLLLYIKEGRSVEYIADRFGCSRKNVYRHCSKHGISLRKEWADIPLEELETSKPKDLADKYNVPVEDIYKLRQKYNIVINSPKDLLDETSLKSFVKDGYCIEDIAVLYRCSPVTIVRYLEKYRIMANYRERGCVTKEEKASLDSAILRLESWEVLKNFSINYFQYQNAKKRLMNREKSTKIDLKIYEMEYIINGKTHETIAKELDVPVGELERFRIKHRIPKLN